MSLTGANENTIKGAAKRRWPRYRIDVRIRAAVYHRGALKAIHGRGTDLGQGGMAAFLPIELSVGDMIELDLTLPYCRQPLKVQAIVRNRQSFTYGIEFTNITPAQQAEIERICQALSVLQ
jgi:c-di-GMP-binding flagellar brake protein YcgR